MKLGKKASLVLGAVVIVAALVVVGVFYSRQAGQMGDLNDRMDRAEILLPGLTASKNNLEDQLVSAQSLLEASQAQFPASVESIEYGEYLFEIADECNVKLDSLSFPKPVAKRVGLVTYSVVSLTLPVTGTLDNIFLFIDTIRTDDRFASTQVKTVSMNAGGKATISVDIYGYQR